MKKLVSVLLAIVLCLSALPILASAEDSPDVPTSVEISYQSGPGEYEKQVLKNDTYYSISNGFAEVASKENAWFYYKGGVLEICYVDSHYGCHIKAEGGTLTIQPASGVTSQIELLNIGTTGDLVLQNFENLSIVCDPSFTYPSTVTAKNLTVNNCKKITFGMSNEVPVINATSIAVKGNTGMTVTTSTKCSSPAFATGVTPTLEGDAYVKISEFVSEASGSTEKSVFTADGTFPLPDTNSDASGGLTVDVNTLKSNTAYTTSSGIVTVMPAAQATSELPTITLYNATIKGQLTITVDKLVRIVSKGTNTIDNGTFGAAISAQKTLDFQGDENSSLTLKGAPAVKTSGTNTGSNLNNGKYALCNTSNDALSFVKVQKGATVTLDAATDATFNMSGYWGVSKGSTLNIAATTLFANDTILTIYEDGTMNINRDVTLYAGAATITNNGTLQNDGSLILADNTTAENVKYLKLTGWGTVRADTQYYSNEGDTINSIASFHVKDDTKTSTDDSHGIFWNAETKTLTLTNLHTKKAKIDITEGDVTIKIKGKAIVANVIEVSGSGQLNIVGDGAGATLRSGALLASGRDVYIENIAVSNAYHKDFVNSYNADSTGVLVNSLDMKAGSTYQFENLSLTSKNPDGLDKIASGLPSGYEIQKATGDAGVQIDRATARDFTITAKAAPSGSYIPTLPPTVTQPGVGGTVEVSNPYPTEGDKIFVTPKNDDGYVIDTITVKDSDGNVIEIHRNNDGSFDFIQPSTSVTIEVTYKEQPKFVDVKDGDWFHDAVDYAVLVGMMSGTSSTTFEPNEPMTRAMFATVLWNYAGKPTGFTANFKDVKSGDWFYDAVAWASSKNVISGMGNGKFEPNEPITREQMVTMLWNFTGKPESSVKLDDFTDGNLVSSWALQAMQWAAENCVISGKEHNNLDPKGTATRAEAACILVNYCGSGF